MMNTMGLILTGWKNPRLRELTDIRSSSALMVGGKYRAIDFVLSNMVISGIKNVGVLTQYAFRSLMDHLGSGKEWDLDRKRDGLYIFPPSLMEDNTGWYRGSADAIYNNLTFLRRSNEEYVLLAQGNGIYKMVFDELLEFHRQKNADITVCYREMHDFLPDELTQLGILALDENERIIDLQEKPLHPKTIHGSMGVYIMKRELLIALVEECTAHGNYDFVKDILIKKLDQLRIFGFRFNGYWRNMSTVSMYYRCNMELLNPDIRHELFVRNGKVYTKVKDEPPAKYNDEAEVRNSIVADGCVVEGTVEGSVLFRGVTVKKGAVVRNSIIMQGSVIHEDVSLDHAILDKNVTISSGISIKGAQEWPVIISKNTVV